jgi:methylmalonyl-CoA carboxyltransferase 12S subunit
MKPEITDWVRLGETLEELRSQLDGLSARLAALETAAATKPSAGLESLAPGHPPAAATAPQPDGVDEELLLVISAAIAGFLGKKPHIRQIHVLGHAAWAQQGRVTIQASHRLAVPHH